MFRRWPPSTRSSALRVVRETPPLLRGGSSAAKAQAGAQLARPLLEERFQHDGR